MNFHVVYKEGCHWSMKKLIFFPLVFVLFFLVLPLFLLVYFLLLDFLLLNLSYLFFYLHSVLMFVFEVY